MVAALTEHPEAVWAGAAAQAVLAAAVPDLSHLGFWCGRDGLSTGLLSIDAGTGYWGMSWVQGGRAVIYGRDHHSDTHLHVPPVDLLAGAPDWLPWDWLHDVMTELDTVAYVFWWNGTAWARAPHPADADPGQCHSSGRVEEAYLDLVDPHRYRDAVRALDDLHRAARDRTVTRAHVDALTRLLDETALTREPDPRAALDTARTCGVAPGATRPELPAGHGEPADRRVVFTGAPQRLLSTAMRQAAEQHRPPPDPGTALDRVADWLRARHPQRLPRPRRPPRRPRTLRPPHRLAHRGNPPRTRLLALRPHPPHRHRSPRRPRLRPPARLVAHRRRPAHPVAGAARRDARPPPPLAARLGAPPGRRPPQDRHPPAPVLAPRPLTPAPVPGPRRGRRGP